VRRHFIFQKVVPIGLLAATGLYMVFFAAVWEFQEKILFHGRTAEMTQTPESLHWPYEEVWVDVSGGRTHGWWLPVENAKGAVLFSHGSGKNISHYLDDAACFRENGFSVLLYDYGGYGQSTGNPSENRCYTDIRAMYKHLVQTRGIPEERIVLAGCSMGGGVTADLAANVKPGAVILESTFLSIPDAAADTYWWLPTPAMTRTQYRNIDKVPHIQSPVLVVHSRDDTVVPFEHGRRLYEAVKTPKQFVEIHGSHSRGKFESKDIYGPALKKFLDEYFKPGS
jgi:alpha-beta hydrolase superfamily lysophospholipase